jgi:uncharacterized lipoprotein
MRIAQPLAVLLLASLATVSVTGCNSMRKAANVALPGQPFEMKQKTLCKQDNKDYVGAQELPPLKAPEGLESPDTRNTLRVPPLNTPERMRGRDEACLDVPPPFSTAKTAPAAPAPVAPPAKPREVPTE